MASKQLLPADLTPKQVVALQDALLANADRLLSAALAILDKDDVPLARSMAILGMEESGKAIALHERRVAMAYAPEGEAFVNQRLIKLWGLHSLKLEIVHDFLVREEYWFGTESSNPEANAQVLGAIEEWKREHNALKQRGFYVDVTPEGDPLLPQDVDDAETVRFVIGHVHQIGWQLRLGEHIEGKQRRQREEDIPPAGEEEMEAARRLWDSIDPSMTDGMIESMREGRKGEKFNNEGYAFHLPSNPFENVGRPGYEAQDRELRALMQDTSGGPEENETHGS